MPLPLIVGAVTALAQSPFVKQLGAGIVQGIGNLFHKKKRGGSVNAASSSSVGNTGIASPLIYSDASTMARDSAAAITRLSGGNALLTSSGGLGASLVSKQGGILDQVGEVLGKVTKPSREFEVATKVDPGSVVLIGAVLLGIVLVIKSK